MDTSTSFRSTQNKIADVKLDSGNIVGVEITNRVLYGPPLKRGHHRIVVDVKVSKYDYDAAKGEICAQIKAVIGVSPEYVMDDGHLMHWTVQLPSPAEMMLQSKHTGLKPYRLADNWLEAKFAEAWQEQNIAAGGPSDRPDTLDQMLHMGDQRNVERCSERDRQVANTVIQWLGSPVGAAFIRDVLES